MHSFLQLAFCLLALVRVGRSGLPTEVDWRKKGAVTPVKRQGDLATGWAFSVTGALEGQHFRKTDHLVSLSEQQLVDCATGPGPVVRRISRSEAFNHIIRNRGIDTEVSYPYENRKGECRFNVRTVGATCSRVVEVGRTESALREAVADFGPISVLIDASRDSFARYKPTDGVYNDPRCNNSAGIDAVLVVGYGVTKFKRTKYWIVKNSRGPEWGDGGYIRMSRDKDNQCGIANSPMLAAVPR